MKIVRWEAWKQNLKLTKPYSIANHYFDSVENLFIRITLENGIFGIGAGSPSEFVCSENIDQSLQAMKNIGDELLLNQDVRGFIHILDNLPKYLNLFPAAMACIDIALHDAYTKYLDIRVVDFYGPCHTSLPTSVTLGIMSVEESKDEVLQFMKKGFTHLKVKIGEHVDKDIELCHKIFDWTKGKMSVRVDGNQGYDSDSLKKFVQKTESLNLEFIEQPMPCRHLDEVRKLDESLRKISMADEDLHGPEDVPKLLSPSPLPYHLFNIKLMKCGGIFRGRQIARQAQSAQIPLMWGCMDESAVSIGAALHVAFASPNTRFLDLDGHLDLAEDIVTPGFELVNGQMRLLDRPGIGYKLSN